jgi:hypothetical protein
MSTSLESRRKALTGAGSESDIKEFLDREIGTDHGLELMKNLDWNDAANAASFDCDHTIVSR